MVIEVGYGSQVPADEIRVTIYLVKSWTTDETIATQFFPASYDQYGNLTQGYFSYTWYNYTMTLQMQEQRAYNFNYDSDGILLLDGFCYDENRYIYYDPL